jgi:hypothetical protein
MAARFVRAGRPRHHGSPRRHRARQHDAAAPRRPGGATVSVHSRTPSRASGREPLYGNGFRALAQGGAVEWTETVA